MSSKKASASQLRKFRSDVAKLKEKGLVSQRVDARSQKMTRYMREQVKKYSDVLEGRAKVVHVPRTKDAKQFDNLRHKGKSVVVPTLKGETARYDKKTGTIRGYRQIGERKIKRVIGADPKSVKGDKIMYSIPLGRPGERWRFDSWEAIREFFSEYEKTNRYPNWEKYVEIEIAE